MYFLNSFSYAKGPTTLSTFPLCLAFINLFLWLECLMAWMCYHLCSQPCVGGFLYFVVINQRIACDDVGFACGGVAYIKEFAVFSSCTCLI